MKILMICDFFHEDQQYQENLLVKYYLKQGHSVTLIASTFTSIFEYYSGNYQKTKITQEYHIKGYKVIRQPYSINLLNKLRKLKKLQDIISNEAPDLIYIHGVPLNLIEPLSYKKKNPQCRLVFDSHADYSNSAQNWISLFFLHKIIYRSILRMLNKKLDKIFYITPNGGTFLNKVYGIPNNEMALLPLGADLDYIDELKKKKINSIIREKLQIKQNDFVIFAGGKLTKEKQIELVIKAFFQLKNQAVQLIIIGDTKDEIYKKEILSLINSHPRIHVIGWVYGQEVYSYMLACDVAVFPASQSVLWQQAIGCGLPLIIGKTNGQDATYLNKNDNIFILEKNHVNENKISDLLNLLIEDNKLLWSMKMAATKTANEFLSYERISNISIE